MEQLLEPFAHVAELLAGGVLAKQHDEWAAARSKGKSGGTEFVQPLLREPGGGRADEGNRRQYRRGGVILSQAVFTDSCSDSTCAGRLRGASQLGPIHRRQADSPILVGTIEVWIPPSGRSLMWL